MLSNLKIKISLWYTLLLTAILAGTLFSVYQIVGYQMKSEIATNLETTSRSLVGILLEAEAADKDAEEHHHHEGVREQNTATPPTIPYLSIRRHTEMLDDNYLLLVIDQDKVSYITERYSQVNPELGVHLAEENMESEFRSFDLVFSLTSFEFNGTRYILGYEMSSLNDLQTKMIRVFMIVFPIGILLSFICGFVVTQGTMRIINRINETTKNITSVNLSNRIAVPRGNDEISRLIFTLNSMFDRLEKAFSLAKQFSQDAAHELRTPLTIMRGEVEEMMEEGKMDQQSLKKLENILEEIQNMSSMAEKLLLINTMDTEKIKYHFENVDLSDLQTNICQDASIISSGNKISIDSNISPNILLNCNKELITRLMWNLIDNAIKYNNPGGKIHISMSASSENVIIEVRDSGIGIPKEESLRIFDRFYRIDKSRSRELGGSGLGLAICKWIIELHNGSISLESIVNQGSSFTILLPLHKN